jgi:uncharacterized protein YcbK (DUF882 family)
MSTLLSRREALAATTLLPLSLALPAWAQQAQSFANDFWLRPRTVFLRHHSGDWIQRTYWQDGELIDQAHQEISWFMRDRVTSEAVYIHPVLLDVVYGVNGWLNYFGVRDAPDMTSAFRSYGRNLNIEGAAKDSEHTKGKALDFRIRGISSLQTAKFGAWLGGGGVGWYPGKDFTHLDTGRLRVWRG